MATVTGLTAARMKEIADASIVDARLNDLGELILTTEGGQDINVGSLKGPKGDQGPAGTVTKVAGIGDDGTGNVPLKPSDFGAASTADIAAALPPGTIVATGRSTAPAGWVLCQGQALARTGTYAALFGAIGTAFTTGSSTTTFNVPDLRARAPMGRHTSYDEFDTLGETGGSRTSTIGIANMPSHDHGLGSTDVSMTSTNNPSRASGTTDNGGNSITSGDNSGRFDKKVQIRGTTLSTGSGTPLPILSPYQVVNYMIKI